MKVKYLHSHINDPVGSYRDDELLSFLMGLPAVGITLRKSKIIPPISALNELFGLGKRDAGMSGCFEWQPFRIDERSYDELVQSLIGFIGGDCSIINEQMSLDEWMEKSRSAFGKK